MRVRSSDAEIFYDVMGKGPPLVLLHPFPANRGIWMPVAEMLATRYRIVLPDLRGHGDSGVGEGPATMGKHADDITRVCDDAGVSRAIFGGISIGGYILFEFWRRHRERVSALILCDTKAAADNDEGRRNRLKAADDVEKHGPNDFLDSMIARLLGQTTRTNRPDVVGAARAIMAKSTVPGLAAVQRGMAERPDSVPTLATINVPTLVLVGEEDVLTPVSEAETMRRNIPNATMAVIPKAGHYAPFEQPQESGRVIRQFLDRLPA